jgi:hypothetical protein
MMLSYVMSDADDVTLSLVPASLGHSARWVWNCIGPLLCSVDDPFFVACVFSAGQ